MHIMEMYNGLNFQVSEIIEFFGMYNVHNKYNGLGVIRGSKAY